MSLDAKLFHIGINLHKSLLYILRRTVNSYSILLFVPVHLTERKFFSDKYIITNNVRYNHFAEKVPQVTI